MAKRKSSISISVSQDNGGTDERRFDECLLPDPVLLHIFTLLRNVEGILNVIRSVGHVNRRFRRLVLSHALWRAEDFAALRSSERSLSVIQNFTDIERVEEFFFRPELSGPNEKSCCSLANLVAPYVRSLVFPIPCRDPRCVLTGDPECLWVYEYFGLHSDCFKESKDWTTNYSEQVFGFLKQTGCNLRSLECMAFSLPMHKEVILDDFRISQLTRLSLLHSSSQTDEYHGYYRSELSAGVDEKTAWDFLSRLPLLQDLELTICWLEGQYKSDLLAIINSYCPQLASLTLVLFLRKYHMNTKLLAAPLISMLNLKRLSLGPIEMFPDADDILPRVEHIRVMHLQFVDWVGSVVFSQWKMEKLRILLRPQRRRGRREGVARVVCEHCPFLKEVTIEAHRDQQVKTLFRDCKLLERIETGDSKHVSSIISCPSIRTLQVESIKGEELMGLHGLQSLQLTRVDFGTCDMGSVFTSATQLTYLRLLECCFGTEDHIVLFDLPMLQKLHIYPSRNSSCQKKVTVRCPLLTSIYIEAQPREFRDYTVDASSCSQRLTVHTRIPADPFDGVDAESKEVWNRSTKARQDCHIS
mmetsp:Transcript_998/g.1751  ORF Transcript_998/g.1751 Transcript_998/m.1751 type:complete len:585 (-) Transcript_998:68-1822(-)